MAITSVDLALAGMKPATFLSKTLSGTLVAGRPWTPFYTAGIPATAVANAAGLTGLALTTYAGQIPVPAASGNTHLAKFSAVSSAQGGIVLLCDRLWHNSGIVVTTTTAQTVNSVAWPARDTNASTNGEGVYIGLEVSTVTGAGASVISISYTNSAGVAGRTGTAVDVYGASSLAGSFYRFALQAGDTGVRSVQTFTSTVSMTSGVVHLVAYRVIGSVELITAGLPGVIDPLTGGLPREYDNTVLFPVYLPQTTTSTQLSGTVIHTQG